MISAKDLDKADEFLADMKTLAAADRPTEHFGASKCGACPYQASCVPEFKAEEDLGQNYFVDSRAIPHLESLGISTF